MKHTIQLSRRDEQLLVYAVTCAIVQTKETLVYYEDRGITELDGSERKELRELQKDLSELEKMYGRFFSHSKDTNGGRT